LLVKVQLGFLGSDEEDNDEYEVEMDYDKYDTFVNKMEFKTADEALHYLFDKINEYK
jgi:hypothetical protein